MIELNLLPSKKPSDLYTNNMDMNLYTKNMSMQIYSKSMNIDSFLDSLANKIEKNKTKKLNSSSRDSLRDKTNSNSLNSLRNTKILKKNPKINNNNLNGILASPGTIGSNYEENSKKFFNQFDKLLKKLINLKTTIENIKSIVSKQDLKELEDEYEFNLRKFDRLRYKMIKIGLINSDPELYSNNMNMQLYVKSKNANNIVKKLTEKKIHMNQYVPGINTRRHFLV